MSMDQSRRDALKYIAAVVAAGAVMAVAEPFLHRRREAVSVTPSRDVKVGELAAGGLIRLTWMHRPVYVLRRDTAMLAALGGPRPALHDPLSRGSVQPRACRNVWRSLRPELLVVFGSCTHQGCALDYLPPTAGRDAGLFRCPCDGSRFDLAGRVYAGAVALRNLDVPYYEFKDADTVRLIDPAVLQDS